MRVAANWVTRCTLELIGGPYDGAKGLGWVPDVFDFERMERIDPAPPEQILVGRCPGEDLCEMRGCSEDHVAYWDAQVTVDPPVATEPYTRVSANNRRARYVHASLDLDTTMRHRELVGAGMGG